MTRPRVSYTVRLPMPAIGDAAYRLLSIEDFDVRTDWRGRPVKRWTLELHLNGRRQPDASATFELDADGNWALGESFLSARCRGTGLDETLLRQADLILRNGQ
jgi:hypothetical protein